MTTKCATYKMVTVKEANHRGWCKFCSKKCDKKVVKTEK